MNLWDTIQIVFEAPARIVDVLPPSNGTFWVARDMDGTLRAFRDEPIWDEEYEEDWQGEMLCFIASEEKYRMIHCGEKKLIDSAN